AERAVRSRKFFGPVTSRVPGAIFQRPETRCGNDEQDFGHQMITPLDREALRKSYQYPHGPRRRKLTSTCDRQQRVESQTRLLLLTRVRHAFPGSRDRGRAEYWQAEDLPAISTK